MSEPPQLDPDPPKFTVVLPFSLLVVKIVGANVQSVNAGWMSYAPLSSPLKAYAPFSPVLVVAIAAPVRFMLTPGSGIALRVDDDAGDGYRPQCLFDPTDRCAIGRSAPDQRGARRQDRRAK
jgi:hypothetical protein